MYRHNDLLLLQIASVCLNCNKSYIRIINLKDFGNKHFSHLTFRHVSTGKSQVLFN